jgi:outer membrane protein X
MKKLLFAIFLFCTFAINAQNISFQFVTGLGAALSFGDLNAYGISAAVEPKIFIGDNIAAGFRLEGNALFGGNINTDNTEEISVGVSARTSQTIKGEYYFTDSRVRPYAGLGLGRFTQANLGASGSGGATITASDGFGFAPEVGLALGNFRFSALFNIVPGKDLVQVTIGDVREVSKNYMVLQMSWKLFGIR